MRIVIDMQGAQTESRFRGIGRYTMSFTHAVVRNRGKHEIILALNGLFPDTIEPIRVAFDGVLLQENIRVWNAVAPVACVSSANDWRRQSGELVREAFLASLRPDIVHVSSLFEGYTDDAITSVGRFDRATPVSVTLYDLIPLLNPDHYLKPNPRYAQYYQRKVDHLKQAALYLAISEFTRKEGLAHLNVPESRIVNVTTAIESCFQPVRMDDGVAAQLRQKFGLSCPFVLYTGGADERKNLPHLIQAFAALPTHLRGGHQLVLAGQIHVVPYLKEYAKSAGLKPDELCFTGYVTDEELVQLYNLCKLFVFPSWHEGFGLPALEAMACGAPVIGANTSSLPEVIGLDAALFDPHSVPEIAAKMAQVMEDSAFRNALREHGLQQAAKFSWDEVAKRSINAFEQKVQQTPRSGAQKADGNGIVKDLLGAIARLSGSEALSESDLLAVAAAIAQNHPEPGRHRKLFVDISELVQRDAMTGVQRVTRSILRELSLNPPQAYEVHAVYATIDQHGYRLANNFTRGFLDKTNNSVVEDSPMEAQPGDIFLGLDLQHHTTRVQESYLSQIRRNGTRIWFVVYDLLPVLFPSYWPSQHRVGEIHEEWLGVITKFDGVVCISKAVADELADWLQANGRERLRPLHMGWFHLGTDIQNSDPSRSMPSEAEEVIRLLQTQPTFLMVGTLEPRKGHAQVLEAFEQLWQASVDANLVIVGKQGWMVETLVKRLRAHPELNERLFWLEGISDEYLEKVYAASACLIAASEGEGFGLPLIEAARHKVPIIARDIPVFREVAGEHAYYFTAKTPDDLAQRIKVWLGLFESNRHPKSDQIRWLTWKDSARQLVEVVLPRHERSERMRHG